MIKKNDCFLLLRIVGIFLALALVGPGWSTAAEQDVSLLVGPGFPTRDQGWLVPVVLMDEVGQTLEMAAGDLEIVMDDSPVQGFRLGYFAPEPVGYPSSTAVLVDQDFPQEGMAPLMGFLNSGNSEARRSLFRCGPRMSVLQELGDRGLDEAALSEGLAGSEPSRLWDCLLEAITALGDEGPTRKVLLVVSDGDEKLASEHPLATCIEAAVRTRVAIQVLELGSDPGKLARLRELARKTGGKSEPYGNQGDLVQSLARIDAARSLWIPAQEFPLPVELIINLGDTPEVVGIAQVAEPKALSSSSIVLVLGLGLAVVLVVIGAVLLLKMKARLVGVLLVDFQGAKREVPIRRSGLAVGADSDNQLVLADNRISRHHAVIRMKSGEVILTDLRSRNGTRVNGQVIRNVALGHGDRIHLGKAVELIFQRPR